MGEIANSHVGNFLSGRWGIPLPPQRENPTTTREAIAGNTFSIVKVRGGNTNRIPGTKLIVCDQNDEYYWVWASEKVTGIAKNVCQVLHDNLTINEALVTMGRKPYFVEEDI